MSSPAQPVTQPKSPNSIGHVAVVVPAHDERALIGRSLSSLLRAREALPPGVSCSIVVAADACTDSTAMASRLRLCSRRDLVLDVDVRSAGAARRLGTAAGLAASPVPAERVWISCTDSDTVVGDDWITRQLALAESGAEGVAGIVVLQDDGNLDAGLRRRFASSYRINADGSHEHVHGANLGVRADAYLAAGGFRNLQTGEEHDLWNRLRALGCDLVSTAELVVATSARLSGRAPNGFAADLLALDGAVA